MAWLISQAMMNRYSNSHCSRVQAAGFLAENCSDGEPSVQSSVMPSPHKFWHNDKTMEFSNLSQFGQTCAVLTEHDGEDVLMSYLEDFPVKTSVVQESTLELGGGVLDCGVRWQELLAKFSRDSCSWKTHRCLFIEDLELSSLTWPAWGMTRDGELLERVTLPRLIAGNDYFSWLTPLASQARRGWGVPLNVNPEASPRCGDRIRRNTLRDISEFGWKLNPFAHEWLMAWPHGWTDLKPLETDKFQSWQQQHGDFCQVGN